MKNYILIFSFVYIFIFNSSVIGADFQYPELLASPKASQRLQMESQKEYGKRWLIHWPIQVSAISTLASGFMQMNAVANMKRLGTVPVGADGSSGLDLTPLPGLVVGGGWLALTAALSSVYEPYKNGSNEIKDLPNESTQQKLVRERLAEEAINSPARLGSRLRWISFGTNLAANLIMSMNAKGQSAQLFEFVAAGASALPLFFTYSWEQIADDQTEYKKKIYGPVTMDMYFFGIDPIKGQLKPAIGMNLHF